MCTRRLRIEKHASIVIVTHLILSIKYCCHLQLNALILCQNKLRINFLFLNKKSLPIIWYWCEWKCVGMPLSYLDLLNMSYLPFDILFRSAHTGYVTFLHWFDCDDRQNHFFSLSICANSIRGYLFAIWRWRSYNSRSLLCCLNNT